ncbi:MAG: hypothetical protein WD066_11760 [Planctomycetaceae bacterium]
MWSELRELVRAWWTADRIRVSPREGRLLRLRPGDVVVVRGCAAEVRTRTERRDALPPSVTYECVAATGTARLAVFTDARGEGVSVEWIADDAHDARALPAIDSSKVEVYPRATDGNDRREPGRE